MARIRLRMLYLLVILMAVGCRGGSPELPPVGFKVEFTGQRVPGEMTTGQRLFAAVSLKNASPRTWPSKPNGKGRNAVNFSYHWLDQKNRAVVFDGLRTPLPHDLRPGDAVELNAAIQAPERPGRYTLVMTLVQEGVAWFSERDGAITVPVQVSEAAQSKAPQTLTPESRATRSPNDKPGHPAETKKSTPTKKLAVETPAEKKQTRPRTVKTAPAISSRPRTSRPWSVQIGSYAGGEEAGALAKRLKDKGYDSYVAVADVRGKKWYRVRVGHLDSQEEARRLRNRLTATEGFKEALVTNRK